MRPPMWVLLGLALWAVGATLALLLVYAHGEQEERSEGSRSRT